VVIAAALSYITKLSEILTQTSTAVQPNCCERPASLEAHNIKLWRAVASSAIAKFAFMWLFLATVGDSTIGKQGRETSPDLFEFLLAGYNYTS